MTGSPPDPTLEPVPLPGPPPPLGEHEAPVARAAPAGPAAVLLEGHRVALLGSERRGIQRMILAGATVLEALSTDAGTAANVVVTPATLRRELVGPGGTTFETVLAVPSLPLAAVQWGGTGAAPGRSLTVEFTLLPGAAARHGTGPAGVRAVRADDGLAVDASLHPAPTTLSAEAAEGGGVRVRASVPADAPVTLVVAAGPPEAVGRTLAAVPHLGSHEIRAAASADPAKMHTLVVRTGVPEIDQAVVWATARVDAASRRPDPAGAEDLFWTGVGALGIGDAEAALLALEGIPDDEALGAFLAARYALFTGDQDPALARYGVLHPETLDERRNRGRTAWGPWQDALLRLADALRNAVPEQELDGIRRFASQPAGGDAGKVVRLPMAGGGSGTPPAANATWPGRLLGGVRGRVEAGAPPPHLEAWAHLVRDRVDEGWAAWRRSLAEALAGESHGRGAWDPAPEPWGPGAPGAGIALGMLAHGLLGIDPDEPSGRLGLAPNLPRHLTAFRADGIRVGDASISLDYRREEATHRFRLEPLGGRVPVMAIFAPSLPETALGEILVDGEPAELDATAEGGRLRLEVQIPLDAVRTLDVTGG